MNAVSRLPVSRERPEEATPRDVLLDVADVTKEYETREGDEILALDRISLTLR